MRLMYLAAVLAACGGGDGGGGAPDAATCVAEPGGCDEACVGQDPDLTTGAGCLAMWQRDDGARGGGQCAREITYQGITGCCVGFPDPATGAVEVTFAICQP